MLRRSFRPAVRPNLLPYATLRTIHKISWRAVEAGGDVKLGLEQRDIKYELEKVHLNGCLLDFDKLLAASPADVEHDLVGIHTNIDLDTGELLNGFIPRCAVKEVA